MSAVTITRACPMPAPARSSNTWQMSGRFAIGVAYRDVALTADGSTAEPAVASMIAFVTGSGMYG